MSKSISVANLQKADLIASTTQDIASKGIRHFTHSKYSHIAMYYGSGLIIEAVDKGVVLRSMGESLGKSTRRDVYRMPGVDQRSAIAILQYATSKLGRKYDAKGAVQSKVSGLPTDSGDYFCSQLVVESYQNGGQLYDLGKDTCYPPAFVETLFNDHRVQWLGSLAI